MRAKKTCPAAGTRRALRSCQFAAWCNCISGLSKPTRRRALPAPQGAVVHQPLDRKISPLIGLFRAQCLVDFHAVTDDFAAVHEAVFEAVGVRENVVGTLGVVHLFLHAQAGHPGV